MQTSFTPGPWTAYDFGADWWVATDADDSGPMLRVGGIHAHREANANLIAVAPELYAAVDAACDLIHEHAPGLEHVADQFERLLAKARGEQVSA